MSEDPEPKHRPSLPATHHLKSETSRRLHLPLVAEVSDDMRGLPQTPHKSAPFSDMITSEAAAHKPWLVVDGGATTPSTIEAAVGCK